MNTIIYTPEEEIELKKELKELIDTKPCQYGGIIKSKQRIYLLRFINNNTLKLQDPFYKLATKVYWLLHNLTDFPKCPQCGDSINKNVKNVKLGYSKYCSNKCAAMAPAVRNKAKHTCLDRYGVENVYKSADVREKIKETCLEKYGVENPMQAESIKKRNRQTCLAKYGVEYSFQSTNNKEKARLTWLKKYGVSSATKTNKVKNKIKATMLKRYGVANSMQHRASRIKQQQRYCFEDVNFDSAPELALYIYLKDHNIDFEYQPKTEFWYTHNNKKHKCMPDFKINDTYVEIKGSHFLDKETGKWRNPWNAALNPLYEAKHQCCLNNNVKILYTEDYQKYVSYINEKYGKDYIKQFKNI